MSGGGNSSRGGGGSRGGSGSGRGRADSGGGGMESPAVTTKAEVGLGEDPTQP
jgi:hypothetical protein